MSDKFLKMHTSKIIRMQAWIRGHLARNNVKILKINQRGGSRYFTAEEAKETVSKKAYQSSQP